MYYVKGESTTQYITLTDGSFVAEYQKLEFCDRLAGGGAAPPSASPRAGIYSRRQRRLGHRTPLRRYTGAWAPSATNKLRRVYTEALLATTVNVRQKRLNIVRISGIIYHINSVNGVYQAILENEKTGIGDMGK